MEDNVNPRKSRDIYSWFTVVMSIASTLYWGLSKYQPYTYTVEAPIHACLVYVCIHLQLAIFIPSYLEWQPFSFVLFQAKGHDPT